MSACLYFFGHLHENLIEDSIKTFPKKNFPLPPNNARGGGPKPNFFPFAQNLFGPGPPSPPKKPTSLNALYATYLFRHLGLAEDDISEVLAQLDVDKDGRLSPVEFDKDLARLKL